MLLPNKKVIYLKFLDIHLITETHNFKNIFNSILLFMSNFDSKLEYSRYNNLYLVLNNFNQKNLCEFIALNI